MTTNFSERSGVRGWCFRQTSTRHSSGSLALKQVRVCSWHSCILLQTAVQFHMEPILILLLYGSALSILSPFLWTFKQRIINTIYNLFLHNSFGNIVTLFGTNVLYRLSTEGCSPPLEKAPHKSRRRWTCRGDSRIISVSICPITSSWNEACQTSLLNKCSYCSL